MSDDPGRLYKAMTRKGIVDRLVDIVARLGGSRAVAAEYGISQRQVQRYVQADREGRTIKSPHFDRLKTAGRRDPRVRAGDVNTRRTARMRNHGARVKMKGTLGVVSAGRRYMREKREIDTELSPEAMERIQDAWLAGDDEAALEALRDALDEEYQPGWDWDDLTGLDFLRH